jgi:hypothetical protein
LQVTVYLSLEHPVIVVDENGTFTTKSGKTWNSLVLSGNRHWSPQHRRQTQSKNSSMATWQQQKRKKTNTHYAPPSQPALRELDKVLEYEQWRKQVLMGDIEDIMVSLTE